MLGVLVNTIAVLAGSTIGLLCKKGIPERFTNAILTGIGLCTVYMGISGALQGENTLILILSIVLGAITGTLLDIDRGISNFGKLLSGKKDARPDSQGKNSFAEGFVTACLMFCIGSMTIVGSLNAGLTGDQEMLLTKSLLDFISSIVLSVSLGIGVLFSSIFVLIFQGALVLLAGVLQPVLTEAAIAEIICAGSVMMIALGLNIMGITKIKTANYLPAILYAPLLCALFAWLGW